MANIGSREDMVVDGRNGRNKLVVFRKIILPAGTRRGFNVQETTYDDGHAWAMALCITSMYQVRTTFVDL